MSGMYLSGSPTHIEETWRCPGAIVCHGMGGSPRNHPLGVVGEVPGGLLPSTMHLSQVLEAAWAKALVM